MVPFEDEKTRSSFPSLSKSSSTASLILVFKLPEFSTINPSDPFSDKVTNSPLCFLSKKGFVAVCCKVNGM